MKWTFTLVELFVVMVIVVIMLTILIPLFDQMGAGNKVNSTAKSIGSELSLARQYAQTNSSFVALIMPGNNQNSDYPGSPPAGCPTELPSEYKFTSYRLAYVELVGNDYTFNRWVEDSKWFTLPGGNAIMEADDDIGIQNNGNYVSQPNDDTVSVVDGVKFGKPLVNTDGSCGDLVANNVRAVIYAATGKLAPTGTFRYITVGEAQWNEVTGNFLIKNAVQTATNESSANQITIEINGFTGGLSYSTPDNYGE